MNIAEETEDTETNYTTLKQFATKDLHDLVDL